MISKKDFLARLPIFEELDEEELTALSGIAEERQYPEDGLVAYQRDVANSLYIVRSGRLLALSVDDSGEVVTESQHRYLPGAYFEESWLFAPQTHTATIKARRTSQVIIIPGPAFLRFLEEYPEAAEFLKLSPQGQRALERSRISLRERRHKSLKLQPDELVEWEARRTIYLLLYKILVPAFFMLVLPFIFYALLNSAFSLTALGSLAYVIILCPSLLALLFILFQIIDWANDYFLITNLYLIHYEFDLRSFSARINKIPIDQVQSVEIEKPDFLAGLFNYGTARITTAAQQGVIRFDYIDDPMAVQTTVNNLRQRVKALGAGQQQAAMRRSVEGHFSIPPIYKELAEPKPEIAEEESEESFFRRLADVWRTIDLGFRSRVEMNGTVLYRKHPFILLREILWPIAVFIILILLGWALRYFGLPAGALNPVLWLLAFFNFLWLIWRVEDWRNDTFQVTDRYVIDIDRLPFGFRTSRKQAELGNVQNVSAVRPTVWATLFNFGNVKIETAGATADIVFENVVNPNQVQGDVFQRREAFQRQQQEQARDRQRREYGLLLDVFQQANEQGRIPNRTPVGDLSEYDEEDDPDTLLWGDYDEP